MRSSFAQIIHDGAKKADAHGVGQQGHGLPGPGQQFGIECAECVDFNAQRSPGGNQPLAEPGGLDGIGNDDKHRRKRLITENLPNALDHVLSFAIPRRGEQQARGH